MNPNTSLNIFGISGQGNVNPNNLYNAGTPTYSNFVRPIPGVNVNLGSTAGLITPQPNTPAPQPQQQSNNSGVEDYLRKIGYNDPNVIRNLANNQPDWLKNALNPGNGYSQLRNDISSGWDSYISSLNDQLNNGLPAQQNAQNDIINSQYNQGVSTANYQKSKSLKDISSSISNAFKAGNNYLGAAGAGDSSAANQYSYALQKESAKQTSNLNEYVNNQLSNLESQRQQGIASVAQWFANAQNQIRQAISQGQLNKSQDLNNLSRDLLTRGQQLLEAVNADNRNKYTALLSWAASNSKTFGELQSNIASIPQPISTPVVDSSGNYHAPTGYGSSTDQNKNTMFSNPAWY